MDLRRARAWDWVAGGAGAALIGSLFLPWYSVSGSLKRFGSTTANAWQSFAFNDVLLLLAGLFGIALLVANATQRTAAIPQGIASVSFLPVLVAALVVVIRALSPPAFDSVFEAKAGAVSLPAALSGSVHREIGLWIGLGAALLLLVACWNAMNDKRLPRAVSPHIETIHAPEPE